MFIAIGSTMTARRRCAMSRRDVAAKSYPTLALHWTAKPIMTSGYKHAELWNKELVKYMNAL